MMLTLIARVIRSLWPRPRTPRPFEILEAEMASTIRRLRAAGLMT